MSDSKSFVRRLVAGVASVATLLTGMAFASTANAATTYTSADDFRPGQLQDSATSNYANNPKLTVTKYLSNEEGNTGATGSSQDSSRLSPSAQPAEGVVFSITEIEATANHEPKDFTNTNGSITDPAVRPSNPDQIAWQPTNTFVAYGKTNARGVIDTWYPTYSTSDHALSGEESHIPLGHHYYVLHEVWSPFEGNYKPAEDSVFDLPYRATNVTTAGAKEDGYVYHLHVFPKNVNNNPLAKRVVNINGKANTHTAMVGDTINYELTYRFDGVTRPSSANPDAGFYLSDIAAGSNGLRVSDRLSSAFGTATPGTVTLTYVTSTGEARTITLAASQYTVGQSATAPTRINPDHSSDPLFTSAVPAGAQVNYVTWNFFNNLAGTSLGVPAGASNIILHMPITAQVTGTDDDLAHDPGALQNDAASDNIKPNQNHQTEAHTASAGFQFAKVKHANGEALQGAVFRLIAHNGAQDHFLATNGQYYTNSTLPAGVSFVEATSNANGLVTFVNIPVFDRDASGQDTFKGTSEDTSALDFDVIEYQAPEGYHRATMPFQHVTWASHAGQAVTAAQQGTHFTPDNYDANLTFGEWGHVANGVDEPSINNIDGTAVTKYLANWENNEPGKPIHLPLTGGQGIVLLLVLGAAIMAIVLVERKRRQAQARR